MAVFLINSLYKKYTCNQLHPRHLMFVFVPLLTRCCMKYKCRSNFFLFGLCNLTFSALKRLIIMKTLVYTVLPRFWVMQTLLHKIPLVATVKRLQIITPVKDPFSQPIILSKTHLIISSRATHLKSTHKYAAWKNNSYIDYSLEKFVM